MIRSLISYSCKLRATAILLTLREKIRQDTEHEIFVEYSSRLLRLTVENLAKMANGNYVKVEYRDLISPQKVETRTTEDIVNLIREKINS